jgi:pyruvate dehydrogenase E2 component (dihydrolipoamide acetyltransferase)
LAIEILMSQFGPEMKEGKIIRWLKGEGDAVIKGESLLEVETEKAIVEIQSPADGILGPLLVGEESIVKVEDVLGHVLLPAEIASRIAPAGAPIPRSSWETKHKPGVGERQIRSDGKARISPLAKRLAEKLGIDINLVVGSGPNGRIIETDILNVTQPASESTNQASEANILPLQSVISSQNKQPVSGVEFEMTSPESNTAAIPVSGLRAIIADRMHESHQVTAPVTLTTEACATSLVELGTQLSKELSAEIGFSIGYNELMVKVVARALLEFRYMNARLEAGTIKLLENIHIGLAVDTGRGLVVPVIRDADIKGIVEIGRELRERIEQVQKGTASPEDLSGGTFTISNLGMYEIDAFTPIINLPQTAILGVGQIKSRPAVIKNQLCVQQMVWLSLTFDHRLVDGAPAARFLQYIKKLIETPELLLV